MPLSADRVLGRAVAAAFAEHGAAAFIEEIDSTPWASVTFSGARHRLALRLSGPLAGPAADAVLPDLGEREFALPGHILIDIACAAEARIGGDVLLTLEALTIEAD
jgi:hypothetical protein